MTSISTSFLFKDLLIEHLFDIQLRSSNHIVLAYNALHNIFLFTLSIFLDQPSAFIVLLD